MKLRTALACVAASIAVVSCGKKADAPVSSSSMAAADASASSPIERAYRQKGASAVDVDRLFEVLPLYLRPTYEKVEFDKESGATVITGLNFGSSDDGFTAKRAELYGVDVEAIEALKSADAAAVDAPFKSVAAKIRLFEIESAEEGRNGEHFEIDALEIDALNIREGGLPKEGERSGLAALFNSFEVAGVYFKGMSVNGGDAADSASGAAVDLAAKDLRFVGIGGGRLGAMIGRDISYKVSQSSAAIAAAGRGLGPAGDLLVNGPLRGFIAPENQTTKVATLEWRGVDFSGLMAYGLKNEEPPVSARNLIDLGTIRLLKTETFIGENRLSSIPETDISAMKFAWLAPSKIRAVTRGGEYDFTAYIPETEKDALAALKSYKLDKVKADSDLAYDWDPDRGGAVFSTGFDSAGFADIGIDFALEGLELKKVAAAHDAGAANPVEELARLKSFTAIVSDETMLDAFYALSALETGGEAKDMRAATPAMMRLAKLELKQKSPKLASYIDAVATFLEDGGTLEVKASPETPVPLSAIGASAAGGPDAMAEAINLTVTRSK